MSGAQRSGDQSMDDILASIRKIISDDGSPGLAADGSTGLGDGTAGAPGTHPGHGAGSDDDLADIFEERPVDANGGLAPKVAGGQVPVEPSMERIETNWPSVDEGAQTQNASGSLTDKLASLGNATGAGPAASKPNSASEPETTSLEETLASVREVAASDAQAQVVSEDNNAKVSASPLPTPEGPALVPTKDAGLAGEIGNEEAPEAVVKPISDVPSVVAVAAPVAAIERPPADAEIGAIAEGSKTIEALVQEALQPMLQQWLDANLPRLVEAKLQEELKRRVQ